jgi:hypothetical protein
LTSVAISALPPSTKWPLRNLANRVPVSEPYVEVASSRIRRAGDLVSLEIAIGDAWAMWYVADDPPDACAFAVSESMANLVVLANKRSADIRAEVERRAPRAALLARSARREVMVDGTRVVARTVAWEERPAPILLVPLSGRLGDTVDAPWVERAHAAGSAFIELQIECDGVERWMMGLDESTRNIVWNSPAEPVAAPVSAADMLRDGWRLVHRTAEFLQNVGAVR